MEKNKSMTIPVGNLNLSSNFKPGDIADSYGISARRYPQLTNSKDKSLVYTGGNILGMTVFNGEIVTVRNENGMPELFVGEELIIGALDQYAYDATYKRSFTGINTKLVVYPDQIYLEKVDGEWKTTNLAASVSCKAVFGSRSVVCVNSQKDITGYGGSIKDSTWSGPLAFEKNLSGKYLCFKFNNKRIVAGVQPWAWDSSNPLIDYVDASDITVIDDWTIQITAGKRKRMPATEKAMVHNSLLGFVYLNAYGPGSDPGKVYVFSTRQIDEQEYYYPETHESKYSCTYECTVTDFSPSGLSQGEIEQSDYFSMYTSGGKVPIVPGGRYVRLLCQSETIQGTYYPGDGGVAFIYGANVDDTYTHVCDEVDFQFYGWPRADISALKRGDVIMLDDEPPLIVSSVEIDDKNESFEISVGLADGSNVSESRSWLSTEEVYATFSMRVEGIFSEFKKGDGVTISGASWTIEVEEDGEKVQKTINNNIAFVIDEIDKSTLYASADIFTASPELNITIERKSPFLDFICEKDNRLYGVNNSEKTIYVSALGDPTNMYAYEGVSTDSFAVAVGGEGNFTGCCKYAESVLFFKEDKIYKLVGSYPAEFALYSYDVDGLESGAEKSAVVINEVLYYKGRNGVFAYTGGIPSLISENFGEQISSLFDAVAGTDGVNYYLKMSNDDDMERIFCYNTRLGLWTLEEVTGDTYYGFVRTSDGLHLADDSGNVYQMNVLNGNGDWMVQFVPFYETIEGKKTYSRLLMRAELPKGSYMIIEVRSDDGPWCEAGKIVGANKGIIPIRLPIARCDKFEIRLRGKGEFVLHDILREYHVGSEV